MKDFFAKKYMKIAIEEARKAGIFPLPNPSVGAVIVKNAEIVGTGYTQVYGGEHAEALAIKEAGHLARGATLYCTLEPCHGTWKGKKRPPCTSKILESGIKTVHIACVDRNKHVAGAGIRFLKEQGITVHVHKDLSSTVMILNEVFEHLLNQGDSSVKTPLPFVHLKIAETRNGKMTNKNNERVSITGLEVRKQVHAMRAQHQLLITSAPTVNIDDPEYTVRDVEGINPAILIIDNSLSLNPQSKILHNNINRRKVIDMNNDKAIFIATALNAYQDRKRREVFEKLGIKVLPIEGLISEDANKESNKDKIALLQLLEFLIEHKVYSIMLEAGPQLSAAFITQKLVSKMSIYIAPQEMEGIGISNYLDANMLQQYDNIRIGNIDALYYPEKKMLGLDMLVSGYSYDIFKETSISNLGIKKGFMYNK